jgi:hypothetical protein
MEAACAGATSTGGLLVGLLPEGEWPRPRPRSTRYAASSLRCRIKSAINRTLSTRINNTAITPSKTFNEFPSTTRKTLQKCRAKKAPTYGTDNDFGRYLVSSESGGRAT